MLRAETEGGLPPLVKHLHVDSTYYGIQQDGGPAGSKISAVIHFVYFWQVIQAVFQRLRYENMREDAESPLVDEIAGFRDRLLAYHSDNTLSPACFLQELRSAQKMSQDPSAWPLLESVAERTFAKDVAPGKHGKQSAPEGAGVVPLDIVSTLLLAWLGELIEDYCRGDKHTKLGAVRDVLGCSVREANLHLGSSGWDIEMALRRFYATSGPTGAALRACHLGGAWSSGSAKLRCKEHECPICITEFLPTRDSVTTGCCYQVICMACAEQLSDEGGNLLCPFCRRLEVRPAEPGSAAVVGGVDGGVDGGASASRALDADAVMAGLLREVRRFGEGLVSSLVDSDTDAMRPDGRARMAFVVPESQLP